MKFDLQNIPEEDLDRTLKVGDVYPAKGGRGHTVGWVVVALKEATAYVLGFDKDGEITTAQNYAYHSFEGRERLGHCPEITNLCITVER